jgi:altronate dehydratase
MQNSVLKIDPKDNVLSALTDLHQGEGITYSDHVYILTSDVPAKHKFGTQDLSAGDDVVMYGVLSTAPGLNLQCTPCNDVECVTAQMGAGANLILFTTGLRTSTGNPIAPSLKVLNKFAASLTDARHH